MPNELLDHFDKSSPKAFQRFLEYLESIPVLQRVLLIYLFSFCSYLIIEYKDDTPFEYPTAFSVWMGMALVASIIGSCIKFLFEILHFVLNRFWKREKSKIEALNYASLILISSFIMMIGLAIAAIFID